MENKRTRLMETVSNITDNEEIIGVIKDFIDETETQFNTISDKLGDVDIECLDNICEARDLANKCGGDLY